MEEQFFHLPSGLAGNRETTCVGTDEEEDFLTPPAAPATPTPRANKSSKFSMSPFGSFRRRYVSLDEPQGAKKKGEGGDSSSAGGRSREQRAHSVGSSSSSASSMKALNFEEIDVDGTPLSSQRSCSEFLRYNSLTNGRILDLQGQASEKKKRGFLSFLFGRRTKAVSAGVGTGGGAGEGGSLLLPQQKRVQFQAPQSRASRERDEAAFLVERLGGGRAHALSAPPDSQSHSSATHRSSSSSSSSTSQVARHSRFQSVSAESLGSQQDRLAGGDGRGEPRNTFFFPSPSSRPRAASSSSQYRTSNTAILQETSMALDMIFGIRYRQRPSMEIELKEIRRHDRLPGPSPHSSQHSSRHSISQHSLLSSLPSFSDHSDLSSSQHAGGLLPPSTRSSFAWESGARDVAEAAGASLFSLARLLEWRSAAGLSFLLFCRRVAMGPQDDSFYEAIRIQPFSTGGYLRGFLVAGFTSLFFNLYSHAMWPSAAELYPSLSLSELGAEGVDLGGRPAPHHAIVEGVLFAFLLLQTFLNILQLPLRISLHLQCWESSRTVDVDTAINLIRQMVQGESWLLNRVLGRGLDALSILLLLFGEAYLWLAPADDPLRVLTVSLCATNLLAFFVRVVIATAFSLSMHDPQVLSDARRRGLSRWDLDVLPTFVFTTLREVTNADCSICLGAFDIGEMLISLPCDKKHSFHAACIRQWLERQNSCPLCQKLV